MDAVSAYPEIDEAIVKGDIVTLHQLSRNAIAMNTVYGKGHRRATLPKWRGRVGQRVKGSVRHNPNGPGYLVTYSYLIGYESTAKASDTFLVWRLAIGDYREHDRTVQEKVRLEKYRNSGQYGVAQ